MSWSTDCLVRSYNCGITVFVKYFLPGNLYCGSNCFSKLIKPGFSTVYNGNISLPMQWVIASVSLCHFLLCCSYFWVIFSESWINCCPWRVFFFLAFAVVKEAAVVAAESFRNSLWSAGWWTQRWEIKFEAFPPCAATVFLHFRHKASLFLLWLSSSYPKKFHITDLVSLH